MGERPSVSQGIKKLIIEQRPALEIGLPTTGNIFEKSITTEVGMQKLLADLQRQYPEATI